MAGQTGGMTIRELERRRREEFFKKWVWEGVRHVRREKPNVSFCKEVSKRNGQQLAFEPREIIEGRILPISRSKLYQVLKSGQLQSIRIGRKILIPTWAIEEFLRPRDVK